MAEAKRARRMALVAAAGGVEPLGTGSPCADCGAPRSALNTGVCWSDTAKTRLTFHYAACDACRSARACKRLREDPAAKLVQMGADAAARTKRPRYEGAPLAAATCTARIGALLEAQGGRCASCAHAVALAAGSGIFMASLDRVGGAGYDDGSAQVLCLGCQRFFNDLDGAARAELTRAVVANAREPRPNHPLAALPVEFERSVSAKLRQMKQREVATDRPSRGAPVELDRAAASRSLCRWGLRCACAPRAHTQNHFSRPSPHTRTDAHTSRPNHIRPTAYTGQCDQRAPQHVSSEPNSVLSRGPLIVSLPARLTQRRPCSRCCIATTTPSTSGATRARANGWTALCGRMTRRCRRLSGGLWWGRARGARSTARTGPRRCAASSSTWSWKRVRRPRGPSCSTIGTL